jgi:hypothetical protein
MALHHERMGVHTVRCFCLEISDCVRRNLLRNGENIEGPRNFIIIGFQLINNSSSEHF